MDAAAATDRHSTDNIHLALEPLVVRATGERRFTPDHLIILYMRLEEELKRKPVSDDFLRYTEVKSLVTVYNHFPGGFAELRAAVSDTKGERTGKRYPEMIEDLRTLHRELQRTVTYGDIDEAAQTGRCEPVAVYIELFESVPYARAVAGISKRNASPEERKKELLDELADLAKRLGRTPVRGEIRAACAAGECYDFKVFRRSFSHFAEAQAEASLVPQMRHNNGNQDASSIENRDRALALQRELSRLAKDLGSMPTFTEVQKEIEKGNEALLDVVALFGSLPRARVFAGVTKVKPSPEEKKAELRSDLLSLERRLGHVPTRVEFDKASADGEINSFEVYSRAFPESPQFSQFLIACRPQPSACVADNTPRPLSRSERLTLLQTLTHAVHGRFFNESSLRALSESGKIIAYEEIMHTYQTVEGVNAAIRAYLLDHFVRRFQELRRIPDWSNIEKDKTLENPPQAAFDAYFLNGKPRKESSLFEVVRPVLNRYLTIKLARFANGSEGSSLEKAQESLQIYCEQLQIPPEIYRLVFGHPYRAFQAVREVHNRQKS